MKGTEHYGFPVWEHRDQLSKGVANGALTAIDKALAGLEESKAEVVIGLYNSTGGQETIMVELGFQPKAVLVSPKGSYHTDGLSAIVTMVALPESASQYLAVTETGFTATGPLNYTSSKCTPYRYLAFR